MPGKTGTAQVISLQGGKGKADFELRDHGWFVFFAPRDNPEIAGVVFAEHALHGAEAARVARHLMETYFAKKEGRPLPEFVPPKPPVAVPPADAPREAVPVRRARARDDGDGRTAVGAGLRARCDDDVHRRDAEGAEAFIDMNCLGVLGVSAFRHRSRHPEQRSRGAANPDQCSNDGSSTTSTG